MAHAETGIHGSGVIWIRGRGVFRSYSKAWPRSALYLKWYTIGVGMPTLVPGKEK